MEARIMPIRFSDITGGGIPFGNNAGRPANPGIGKLYSNGEAQRLELYTASGWNNIVQEVPGVSSVSGNYSESANSGTITINGTNFISGAIASATGTNGVEVQASSTTFNSIVQLSAVFNNLSNQYEPYDIKVTNPSNLFGILPDGLFINASPVWQTSSGSLGSFNEAVSISVSAVATDDSTITYSLASGSSLPSGITLNSSTGAISGTLPNISTNTTYTFTINASDGVNTAVPRAFSITSNALPEVSGGILSSDSTYYYRTFTSNGNLVVSNGPISTSILMVGGGGAGDNDHGGGGGAGGVLYHASRSVSIGTYPIVVGAGGLGNNGIPLNGGDTTLTDGASVLTAFGGGRGSTNNADPGGSGGSGGGGGGANSGVGTRSGGSATQTSNNGGTGYGNNGGTGGGTSGEPGGGGGGAGQAGQNAASDRAGAGGNGLNTWATWLSVVASSVSSETATIYNTGYIAGGGGGGSTSGGAQVQAAGGLGGGGRGDCNVSPGIAGVANTGGGGGSHGNGGTTGADGGSGVVIVRYLKSAVDG
jgi:hypothetical protein